MTILFPDINTVLSLFTGAICSCALLALPVIFWRKAYYLDDANGKKDRSYTMMLGWVVVLISVTVSIMGIITNILDIIGMGVMDGDDGINNPLHNTK